MLRVLYTCIAEQHDLRLVVLAALICLFACFTALNLLVRARDFERGRDLAWMSAAAMVFGSGVWATHFVAELAYRPGLPLGYDTGLTALSIMAAMVVTWLGMFVLLRYRAPAIGGGIVGAAVAAMHYIGMAALRVPAEVHWKAAYVIASLVVGPALAAVALRVLWRGSGLSQRIAATALLVAAICGLHFTSMAAVFLVPNPLIVVSGQIIAPNLLAIAITAVMVVVVALGLSGWIVDDRLTQQAVREARQLRRSEEHLARAQRIGNMGSDVRDLRTDATEWSDESYRIFGVSRDSLTTESFLDLVHPEDRSLVVATRDQSGKGVCPRPFEYRIVRPDGAIRHIYRENELIRDESGEPVAIAGTNHDVTELRAAQDRQKELERQLLHLQKLEALGTLAGGVAHDLNNTLVPIVALSKLAMEDLAEDSPTWVDLKTIVGASERARDLVKQILTFSRKQNLPTERVDLATVAHEALRMMRASLPSTIEIEKNIVAVPPILADSGQLHQIIVNLMTNAAQAIGAGTGKITIAVSPTDTAQLDPDADDSEAAICLTVADTGCGMAAATVNRIFEPFFTTKEVGGGTGLGLSVVHGIVASHGGRIEVRSEPGMGTEFKILLPELRSRETSEML